MSSWISKEEVTKATGWSKRWVETKAASGELVTRTSKERGRNGKFYMEYSVASLPQEARTKLAGGDTPAEKKAEETSILITPLFAGRALPETRVALIDPRDQKQAAERLSILEPLLRYRAASEDSSERLKYKQLRLADGRSVDNVKLFVFYLSEQHGVGWRSIMRWLAAYEKKGGDVALADKRRADKNQSRWAVQNPELAELAAYVLLVEERSYIVAWEQVCARAVEIGADTPSYETVRSFLKDRLSPSMKTLALDGKQAYEGKFAPYLRRGYVDVPSNEIWVSDHMISDVLCQNDVFGDCDLRHIRMQMTNLLDYRSRFLIDTVFSEVGSSRSIVSAMRRGISKYGVPAGFYCDNGKDYRKACKGATPREMEKEASESFEQMLDGLPALLDDSKGSGVMRRLGVRVTYCLPYHAQSKHIERFHRTLHERFDKAYFSYAGPASHLRPDRTQAALAHHGKLRVISRRGVISNDDVAAASALPLASDYIREYEAWIRTYYNVSPQRGIGMDYRSPAEVFQQARGEQPRPMPTREQLAMMLMERTSREVDSCAIRLMNQRFVPASADTFASVIMHELTTQRVTVAYDPCDLDRIAVLDADGHLLCELQPEILMRQSNDAETRQLISESMRQRRALARGTEDSIAALSQKVRNTGHRTGEEVLRQIAALPAAVGDATVQRPRKFDDNKPEAPRYAADAVNDYFQLEDR